MKTTCKNCGSETFYRHYPCRGRWGEQIHIENGIVIVDESFTDNLHSGERQPKTIKCTNCKSRIPNPDYQL